MRTEDILVECCTEGVLTSEIARETTRSPKWDGPDLNCAVVSFELAAEIEPHINEKVSTNHQPRSRLDLLRW